MPIVRIDIYSGFSSDYKRSLLNAVHEALVHSFKIPDDDRNQTIREFSDENFERSGGKTRQFTMIEIAAFSGRSREAKRDLYGRIVTNLADTPGIAQPTAGDAGCPRIRQENHDSPTHSRTLAARGHSSTCLSRGIGVVT